MSQKLQNDMTKLHGSIEDWKNWFKESEQERIAKGDKIQSLEDELSKAHRAEKEKEKESEKEVRELQAGELCNFIIIKILRKKWDVLQVARISYECNNY